MNKIKTEVLIPTEFSYTKEGNTAKIEVYPFEAGFGVSVAHPIRRTLITATAGYAPVGLKIEGVKHEFDSLKGMLEDVASFIINLKNIRFKIKDPNKDEVTVEYTFVGPKEIKGEDLITDEVDVVTPNEYIATLNEEGELKLTLLIKKGLGFVAVENYRDELPEGFIGLDAYFSPIKRVVYNIENVLVEDDPNFEKVIFEVETDGQIDPIDAFKEAITVMYEQTSVFNKVFDLSAVKMVEQAEEETVDLKDLIQPIDDLNLSARSFNSLDRANIKFLGELVLMSAVEVENIKNLGKKSLEEVSEKLGSLGYPINETLPENIASALRKKLEQIKE